MKAILGDEIKMILSLRDDRWDDLPYHLFGWRSMEGKGRKGKVGEKAMRRRRRNIYLFRCIMSDIKISNLRSEKGF